MPVRRIREAGRPNIHWMRSRDSCGPNNQGGNSFSVRKGQSSKEGRQKKKTWKTRKNKVLVGTGIFGHLVWKQQRRWGHRLHRWWDFSKQRFKFQHGSHFKINIYVAEMLSIASVISWRPPYKVIIAFFAGLWAQKNPHFQICNILSPH